MYVMRNINHAKLITCDNSNLKNTEKRFEYHTFLLYQVNHNSISQEEVSYTELKYELSCSSLANIIGDRKMVYIHTPK